MNEINNEQITIQFFLFENDGLMVVKTVDLCKVGELDNILLNKLKVLVKETLNG